MAIMELIYWNQQCYLETITSEQWRIQDFQTEAGALTYIAPKRSRKLHENKRNWTDEGLIAPPPPTLSHQ